MDSKVSVPCRCLIPEDVAVLLADRLGGAASAEAAPSFAGSLTVAGAQDAPQLSDRVVTIFGSTVEQETACRQVLRCLREEFGATDVDESLFVVLVPSQAAAAVVGTRGQRVRSLVENSGASISVNREVIAGLSAQPVTITGTLEQVLAGIAGVQKVLQELLDRGQLMRSDLVGPAQATHQASLMNTSPIVARDHGAIGVDRGLPSVTPSGGGSAILLLSAEAAGYVVGKKGCNVMDLQHRSNTRITLVRGSGDLHGMRCGDILLELHGDDDARLGEGLRLVLLAVAEQNPNKVVGSSFDASSGATSHRPPALVLAVDAIARFLARGSPAILEAEKKYGVGLEVQQRNIGNCLRPVVLHGDPQSCAAAALSILSIVRSFSNAMPPVVSGLSRTGSASNSCTSEQTMKSRAPSTLNAADFSAAVSAGLNSLPSWPAPTPAELAVLAGIRAAGVLDHKLSVHVPRAIVPYLAFDDVALHSGARLQVQDCALGGLSNEGASSGTDSAYCFVTVIGPRLATSTAILYLQERMAQLGIACA